jgi:release factor glutamine methyltransferase
MRPNVTDYEPHGALFVNDDDSLVFYKAIASFCRQHLRPSGACYVEINEQYAEEVQRLFQVNGFTRTQRKSDLFGKERFVKASYPAVL